MSGTLASSHPISVRGRKRLRNYRIASRILGKNLTGSASCWMYRRGLLKADVKAYYVLNTSPLIIYLGNVMSNVFDIAELFKHERVHFIKNFYHTFESESRLQQLRGEVDQFRKLYPQHSIDFICATEKETAMFKQQGISPSHFINKNAFVDESQYQVIDHIKKEFDAIYNGQLAPYKRQELAASIRNLALIVYRHTTIGRTPEFDEYVLGIRELLKDAIWLNDVDSFIPPSEISMHLNRARVGLALSAEEGPMAACMENFLSGLPVVSTPSLGGRDVFFDEEYVAVVDPDAESVAKGVTELIEKNISPNEIRQRTLNKMKVHRQKFINLINDILKRHGKATDFEGSFEKIFVNKLRVAAPFPGALLKHVAKGMPVDLCRSMSKRMNS